METRPSQLKEKPPHKGAVKGDNPNEKIAGQVARDQHFDQGTSFAVATVYHPVNSDYIGVIGDD